MKKRIVSAAAVVLGAAVVVLSAAGPCWGMYHPALGRWLQRDPVGYPDGLNLHAAYLVPGKTDPQGLYVNAIVDRPGDSVWLEAGIVLWGPKRVKDKRYNFEWPRDDGVLEPNIPIIMPGLLSAVAGNVRSGLETLTDENHYYLCDWHAFAARRIRFRAAVQTSEKNHFLSKPGKWHYVEIKKNPVFLGLWGEENAFSPSISTHNNRGGWGVWSYQTAFDYSGWWVAHEILHFAGLWDKYSWITKQPDKDYRGAQGQSTNIMAGGGNWRLQLWQMYAMLEDRLREDRGWVKDKDYYIFEGP